MTHEINDPRNDAEEQTINSLGIIDPTNDLPPKRLDGPFAFRREGDQVEIPIPIRDETAPTQVSEFDARRVEDRVGYILAVVVDGGVEFSGTIRAADVIEDSLKISAADPQRTAPNRDYSDLSDRVEQWG